MTTLTHYLRGVRLYIAIGSLIVTAGVIWWSTTVYGNATTTYIAAEEVFGWLALIILAVTISIGPFFKLFASAPGRGLLFDGRRLLGISAAWFALLHVVIAIWKLFSFASFSLLSPLYQGSFILGIIALIILLMMAFTSFDAAFKRMGIWWFRLHRLVYVVVIVAVLHAILIGAHADSLGSLVIIAVLSLAIFLLEFYAIHKKTPTTLQLVTLTVFTLSMIAVLDYGFVTYLNNKPADTHLEHQGHGE